MVATVNVRRRVQCSPVLSAHTLAAAGAVHDILASCQNDEELLARIIKVGEELSLGAAILSNALRSRNEAKADESQSSSADSDSHIQCHDGANTEVHKTASMKKKLKKLKQKEKKSKEAKAEVEVVDRRGVPAAELPAVTLREHQSEDPFYIVDLGALARQYEQWTQCLPRVRPHYAIKCNPDPNIIKVLHGLGCGFDCASKGEIHLAQQAGAQPDEIIYGNPCKMPSHLRFAREQGVKKMTFDSKAELRKVAREFPDAHLILRVVTDDSHSVCRFSNKFGAPMKDVEALLDLALHLGLTVVGVSFHAGSGCQNTATFIDALHRARRAFDAMEARGMAPWLLDIGGGFPGVDAPGAKITFREIAAAIRPVIDELFPPEVSVVSEPGRYFAAASHHLAAQVYALRQMEAGAVDETEAARHQLAGMIHGGDAGGADAAAAAPSDAFLYYINDGVYGSFNCIFFDHAKVNGALLADDVDRRPKHRSTVFGPTCDGLDMLLSDVTLPKMEVGDWMFFPNMGAYTRAASSHFNGFHHHKIYYVVT